MAKVLEPEQMYDHWAGVYDDCENPMLGIVETALSEAITTAPWRVVELGCGTGRNLSYLAKLGAIRLVGVDLSTQMLAQAEQKLPGTRLIKQDITESIPLFDACADLVIISLVLEHVEDPGPVFSEAARLLKKGGRLLVLEMHPDSFKDGSRASFRDDHGQKFHSQCHPHTFDSLNMLAERNGFVGQFHRSYQPSLGMAERYPSVKRRPGRNWLLACAWLLEHVDENPVLVDTVKWSRHRHFQFFKGFDDPFYNVCVPVKVEGLRAVCKGKGLSFNLMCLHSIMRSVLAVPELCLRLQGEAVYQHRCLRIGSTVLLKDETFGFSYLDFDENLESFIEASQNYLREFRESPPVMAPDGGNDVIHLSTLPWFSFQSVSHARSHRTGYSIPKVSLGRCYQLNGVEHMPVSMEVHHALVDGLHVGQFYSFLDRIFESFCDS